MYPLASKASRDVANLTERNNLHPRYMVSKIIELGWLHRRRLQWSNFTFRVSYANLGYHSRITVFQFVVWVFDPFFLHRWEGFHHRSVRPEPMFLSGNSLFLERGGFSWLHFLKSVACHCWQSEAACGRHINKFRILHFLILKVLSGLVAIQVLDVQSSYFL